MSNRSELSSALRKCVMRWGSSINPHKERGVVMLIALIVLVAMALAGVGLMRSVDTGTLVAGNLAFRQTQVPSADQAIEQAIAWLTANSTGGTLNNDETAKAYFAMAGDQDWTQYDWAANAVNLGKDAAGNTVEYIVERMCDAVGPYGPGVGCAITPVSADSADAGNSHSSGQSTPFSDDAFNYRITARVTDSKNTTTYVQVMAY